jgi:hypothetical protein
MMDHPRPVSEKAADLPPALPTEPVPIPVLPYLTPMAAQAGGVWREGKVLIVAKETVLPPTCVKCNRPSDGRPIRRKFRWYPPAWLLLIFVPYGVLLCFIVVLVIRKSGVVHYSMCEVHRRRRWAWVAGGLALAAAGLGGAIYVAAQDAFQWLPVGLILFIVGLVVAVLAQSLRPKRIDDHYVWLKGAGEDFLAKFPVVPKP